jgi:hypothetical protein
MTRSEAINAIFDIGKAIADEQGLTEVEKEEPWDGLWTGLYDILKERYGESLQTVIFHDGKKSPIDGKKNRYVEIGFRFSDPQVCVFGRTADGYQTLAKIEVSDTVYDDATHKYVSSGHYVFHESQVWRWEGAEMLGKLLQMWKERGGE